MGLVLKLHLDTDPDVYAGANRYFLMETVPRVRAVLRRESDGERFAITADQETEIEDDVWVSIARKGDDDTSQTNLAVRLDFEAPRRIKIDLGTTRRRKAAA